MRTKVSRQLLGDLVAQGMEVKEIASMYGINTNSIYTALSRMGISVKKHRTAKALEYALEHGDTQACLKYEITLGTLRNARSVKNKGMVTL